MSQDFWLGLMVGFFISGVVGWFLVTINSYRRQAGAYNRPQMIMQPTGKTPAQVYSEAIAAQTRIGCLRFLLILYGVGVLAALSEDVRELLMLVFRSALSLL
jgi:hypothetical protein